MKKNNFQQLSEDVTPPPEVKEKVTHNLRFMKFIVSIVDLYTAKAGKTITELFK